MSVLESAAPITDARVLELVASTGMSASAWNAESAADEQAAHLARKRLFTVLSGGFWAAGLTYHVVESGFVGAVEIFSGHGQSAMPPLEAGLFGLAIVFGAWLVAPKAWSSARRLAPDMNLLMIVAVAGAIALGELFEAATVAFLFSLSLYLESWSVGRARNAVATLLDLAPPTARVLREDGGEETVAAETVAVGERFVVRGGGPHRARRRGDRGARGGRPGADYRRERAGSEGAGRRGLRRHDQRGGHAHRPRDPRGLRHRALEGHPDGRRRPFASRRDRAVGDALRPRLHADRDAAGHRLRDPAAAPVRRGLERLVLQRVGPARHRLPVRAGDLHPGVDRRRARRLRPRRGPDQGRRVRRGAGAHRGAGDGQDRDADDG